MEVQAAHWRKQFGALTSQAEEIRALRARSTATASEPTGAVADVMTSSARRIVHAGRSTTVKFHR